MPTHKSFTWKDMQVEAYGVFVPALPAPACSNPDRAAFTDSGTSAEAEIITAWFTGRVGSVQIKGALLEELREDEDLPRLLGLEVK